MVHRIEALFPPSLRKNKSQHVERHEIATEQVLPVYDLVVEGKIDEARAAWLVITKDVREKLRLSFVEDPKDISQPPSDDIERIQDHIVGVMLSLWLTNNEETFRMEWRSATNSLFTPPPSKRNIYW